MNGYTYYIKKIENHYNSFHIHATILVTNNLIEIVTKFLFFFFFGVLNTNKFKNESFQIILLIIRSTY